MFITENVYCSKKSFKFMRYQYNNYYSIDVMKQYRKNVFLKS